jgi:hypothetical protein
MPFNDMSIQLISIAHIRTDEEQKVHEEWASAVGMSALEDLEDEL